MAKKTRGRSRGSRVYWRDRGGERRAYGDFRDYADVGGGREALVPPGAKVATTDPDIADRLATERVEELEKIRRYKAILKLERTAGLEHFASHHLEQKARSGRVTAGHLEDLEGRLRRAVDYFGADRALDTISVRDVERWMQHLATLPNGRGGTLSAGTRRHYLNALSNLYTRAISERCVFPPGYNPCADLIDKPSASEQPEARWLEPHDAALLLESARIVQAEREAYVRDLDAWRSAGKPPGEGPERTRSARVELPILPLVATFLLTGGRRSEVLGLAVRDVNFERRTVTFRPNEHRGLKTRTSHRVVPLWPQLREVLRDHLFGREEASEGLLFGSERSEGMVRDVRKAIDVVAARAGWEPGEIRTRMFRHTYTAARLQTLDRGAPVSPFTVSRELGHGGRQMVERVYGHLGDVRHRSEVVEFRVEDHGERLGDRLAALRAAG